MGLLPGTSAAAKEQESATAPVRRAAEHGVPGQYIVVLKQGKDPRSVAAISGVNPQHVYESALTGFAASLNAGQLTALQHNPSVDYIEQDAEVHGVSTQDNATWGLDRIDQRGLPLDKTFNYLVTGTGVTPQRIRRARPKWLRRRGRRRSRRLQRPWDTRGGHGRRSDVWG